MRRFQRQKIVDFLDSFLLFNTKWCVCITVYHVLPILKLENPSFCHYYLQGIKNNQSVIEMGHLTQSPKMFHHLAVNEDN